VKIISGGQTGVDRAALDAALKHEVDCGGWVPTGRLDELGRIPDRYPVTELSHGSFADRTRQNVRDSGGTVIIYSGELGGGTEETVRFCKEQERPYRLIDAAHTSVTEASNLVEEFVSAGHIEVLNVAGPRESEWPEGYGYAFAVLEDFFDR
jgi:Circularly permutated YpsA SLOG family